MFRKPKKIQRRVFCADDEDDDNGEPEPPPPPIISQNKKESKSVKSSQLLSFADEEEDGEVFKVKKSSQSKRLAKRREKEKKKVTDGDNNKYDNDDDEGHLNNVEVNQTDKPKKKRVTLEGLILAGREALAADGTGDVSDDSGKDEDEDGEDERGFHRYRAETVRAALVPGHIPDAALIHAARKTRQQARELGGDYIPVRSEPTIGSRLMRDDGSADEDDDEGRIHVRGLDLPSDKPKRGTAAAPTDAELDSEVDEWEEQQMQKAMPAIIDITGDSSVETNPFAVAPLPPRLQDAPAHLRPLSTIPLATADDLRAALAVRVGELKLERDATAQRRTEMRSRALVAERTLESCDARRGTLDAEYRRAQAVRGYLTDLVECLDEKMPELEALEARALALHRRRCEFVVERRRADVTDQAHDLLASASRGGGAGRAAEPSDEAKRRRAAEREGRRRARRLRREAAAAGTGAPTRHRDGDSSDDELPPADHHHHQQERESIRAAAANLFADALPAWRGVRGVCARLSRWRRRAPALYVDAYLPQCLPKLIAPYVRHQLILWNPLADEDDEDYERMDWYKCLMMYGVRSERIEDESEESDEEERNGEENVTESSIREDLDLFLVPTIINRVVLPKVSEIVECAWDPLCVRSCVRLRALVVRAAALPACGPALRQLASHAAARLAAALAHDVFLPPLPHHVLEGAGGTFWRRCLGAGVRLLRAALALTAPPPALRADYIVLKLIDTLCTAAGAAPPTLMAGAGAALADTLPRTGQLRALALRRLARLATLSLDRLQTDNPLHLKALEQSRAILNEAKAAE